ncbi:MAG: glycosyltransferase [Arcicella sp.]|nr:glycosyltransferase [Arcicella sp.]
MTIIAICYNHEQFIEECLQSIINQTYKNIELIIVDDFSVDKSREIMLIFSQKNIGINCIFNKYNVGNCRSFNQALKIAKGKYIIDLSTDDVLKPNKIEEQVKKFEESEDIGIVFSDAEYIDEYSNWLGIFYKKNQRIPEGNIYEEILKKSFIMPSSMMIRKSILDKLGGYDENLSYEDFDFWVRSSRRYDYAYVPQILVQQRILNGSHSTKFTQKHNILTPSTVQVCEKALLLNETESENQALIIRLKVVLRQCVFTENYNSGKQVLLLLNKLKGNSWDTRFFQLLNATKIPLNCLYLKYIAFRKHIRFK